MYKNKIARREESASRHINIAAHYDNETLIDKSGKLIQIIRLQGIDSVTKDQETLWNLKNRRNNLLKNFTSDFAVYFWELRRKIRDFSVDAFNSDFPREVNTKYLTSLKFSNLYQNELYLAIITKQPEGLINKTFSFLSHLSYNFDKKAKQEYLKQRHRELITVTQKVINSLAEYNPKILSISEKNSTYFSEPLTFLTKIINFDSSMIPLTDVGADKLIPTKRLFFTDRVGTIEMRSNNLNSKFAAVLSIKGYSPLTEPGMLDQLRILKCEYTITQSYRFYDRAIAKAKLRNHQKEMLQVKDESITQTEEIESIFDDTARGDVNYGLHHFTLVCFADSLDELSSHVAAITAKFTDLDILCIRESAACECGFWAQLPGNFGYICRAADISTENIAALASLHNDSIGKPTNNHWGNAVTIFETLSGSPYYFNFHYKDVGNFLVFGAMGSGKTVLVGLLILQSMKFGGKRIIFDKDRGLEILVRAMGGVYEIIKPGRPTIFNPCQIDDTPENRKFLSQLFKRMLNTHDENVAESTIIEKAISGMYRLPRTSRNLQNIASFFGVKNPNSLRGKFDEWHSTGPHAWLFDNEVDVLDLKPEVLGFDLSHILNDDICKTPALMYLTYRIEQAIEGHRAILFCDEGWNALNDDYFRELINDWSRTPRKKDNIFGLATQVANDTANSLVSKAINESASCKIFFPNPSADQKVYIEDLGLSHHEYDLVKSLPDDQHYFLLNYGRSTNKHSVVLRANLSPLKEILAVISARESTLKLSDEIRNEVGNDPNEWLPIFYQRLK